jgi:hypothetical protein
MALTTLPCATALACDSLGLVLKTYAQKIFHTDVVAISTVYEADL